jgi:hypothetical protein
MDATSRAVRFFPKPLAQGLNQLVTTTTTTDDDLALFFKSADDINDRLLRLLNVF